MVPIILPTKHVQAGNPVPVQYLNGKTNLLQPKITGNGISPPSIIVTEQSAEKLIIYSKLHLSHALPHPPRLASLFLNHKRDLFWHRLPGIPVSSEMVQECVLDSLGQDYHASMVRNGEADGGDVCGRGNCEE